MNGSPVRTIRSLTKKVRSAYNNKGLGYVLQTGIEETLKACCAPGIEYYYRTYRAHRTFTLSGKKYTYFYHRHNRTWENERAVEIPLIQDILSRYAGKRILEVGNVLRHYISVHHMVLDKYEKGDHILNEDVVVHKPKNPYDLIVSISTLEHVGWDENPREDEKIIRAVEHLRDILARNGQLVCTIPIGYHPKISTFIEQKKLEFTDMSFLKRVGKNRWKETDWKAVRDCAYGYPYSHANGLIIGRIIKS